MNNSFAATIILLCLLICPSLPASFDSPIAIQWQQLASPPFAILFEQSDKKHASEVLKAMVVAYPDLQRSIGAPQLNSINLYIAPTEDIYRNFVGKNFPGWSSGVASPSQNLIFLKSADILPDEADNRKIAIHELVHILLHSATNNFPLPRWFNEGLAVYYSGEKAFASSSLISKALLTNSIIELKDIDDVLTYHSEKAQLAYQQSYLAMTYLFEQYGEQKVKEIISLLGEGKNQDQVFLQAIGMEAIDFEYDWYQFIKKKYRWHFLLDFDSYLWILILMLFVLGFILMRRRNKKTVERWERESETFENGKIQN